MFNCVFKSLGILCSVGEHKTNKIYSSTTSVNHIFPGEVKVFFFFFYPVDESPPRLYYLIQMNPVNLLSPHFQRSLSAITPSCGASSLTRIMAFNLFSVIISHLFLRFQGDSFHLVYISFTLHFHRISLPSHSCWFDHPSNVQQRVKIINLFIMKFSPFFCFFCYLRSMCVPSSPILPRCQPNQ
jgi:hypothetical protein